METERTESKKRAFRVGEKFTTTIEKVAHGGHFIARHEGAVFFIRHGIPGEKVVVEVTSTGKSFNRGDVLEVLEPSTDRVKAPCSYAHRLGCGGCDFQHIAIARQRDLKSDVITEQFARIAKMELKVTVEEVAEPLHWRTRAILNIDGSGKAGFFSSRSHNSIQIDDCLTCVPELKLTEITSRTWQPNTKLELSANKSGDRIVASGEVVEGPEKLLELVGEKRFQVSHSSFWQSHKLAPIVLTDAVMQYAELQNGDQVLDLYGGVGLFSAAALSAVGQSGRVDLVEASSSAIGDAKVNFENIPNVNIYLGDVAKIMPRIGSADVVILDPPRDGAGQLVLQQISALNPQRIVYVACDPAALARDCAFANALGWKLSKVRAFDLFPMTHHIEMVALFTRSAID
jgi:tRNA/tmRNA/rRNA uracil-C5-methylase (TrmA/RlmC/RlmD family)